jgi:hypothetical protein
MPGPNGADLWWSGKHKHHGGNIQVLSYPDGFPCWVSDVRPDREHDTTCAKKADELLPALEFYDDEYQIPTLTDLGYVSLSSATRSKSRKAESSPNVRPRSTRSSAASTHPPNGRTPCSKKPSPPCRLSA